MWRAIIQPKAHLKYFRAINKSSVLSGVTVKGNIELTSNRLLNNYPINKPIYARPPHLSLFNRTLTTSNLKEPLNNNDTKKENPTKTSNGKMKKFFTIFVSGCLAYFGFTLLLGLSDMKKKSNQSNDNAINYSSKHLPGKVKVSKSVKIYLLA